MALSLNFQLPKRFLWLFVGFFILAPFLADAHIAPYMVVNTNLETEGRALYFTTEFNAATKLKEADSVSNEEKLLRIKDYFNEYFSVLYGESPQLAIICPITSVIEYSVDPLKGKTIIKGAYECKEEIKNIDEIYIITDVFSDTFVIYDHYLTIHVGNRTKDFIYNQKVLTNFSVDPEIIATLFPDAKPSGVIDLSSLRGSQTGQPENALTYVLKRFVRLGIEHILSGTDHILFLLSAILVLVSIRNILILVTSFTIAHSITLILAGLGYLTLSPYVVEPFIAATIIVVSVRNLIILRKSSPPPKLTERWTMAFGFGLVHGLGFAGTLAQVEIPSRFFVPALLTFNVGVELGQIAILVVVVPFLLLIHKKFPQFRQKILFGSSLVITLVSLFWFIERLGII